MDVNKNRRQIIKGAIGGAIGVTLGNERTQAAPDGERPNCSGLPADVSAARRWLVLRFVHQGDANANMLAPILPGKKTTTIDEVLRYGVFCNGYKALNNHLFKGNVLEFKGATANVEQPEILFEDFQMENPQVDVPARAKAEEDECCRLQTEGLSPEQVVRWRALYGLTRQPFPDGGRLWLFKFCGQTHGTAGFGIDINRADHGPDAIATACIFRNLDEVRLWRLHGSHADFLLGTPRYPDSADLQYACGFTEDELGDMPIRTPN